MTLVNHIKNEVITIHNPNAPKGMNPLLTYIDIKQTRSGLYGIQHRLRLKEIIYSRRVSSYNPGMDFTNAINAGCLIINDFR